MNFTFKISRRLFSLREKHLAEGLNNEEKKEYFARIIEFMVFEILVKVFKFDENIAMEFLSKISQAKRKH